MIIIVIINIITDCPIYELQMGQSNYVMRYSLCALRYCYPGCLVLSLTIEWQLGLIVVHVKPLAL